MALVAVDAVVNVTTNVRVAEIGRIIVPMASRALEHRIVTRIRVAGGTNAIGSAVVQREVRVIKRCPRPRGCGVARRAGCWEPGSLMVRVCRARVVGLVTRIAVRRNCRVIVVHVAIGAGNRRVRTRQRERRVVVVKARWDPCRRVVANVALLREP